MGDDRPYVLVLGLDPARVPGPWDPAPVVAAIQRGLARFAEAGVPVETCLVGLDGSEDIDAAVTAAAGRRPWTVVVVGGGFRAAGDDERLFDRVVALVRRHAEGAAIAFSTAPDGTYEAASPHL